ncbi:MAG: hypothetical protein FD152_4018 [Xanthobacteraceae bacterium]|nr:MAG: hypothetical protein FD152_4018 [Xanthobacteraceae bacterium]
MGPDQLHPDDPALAVRGRTDHRDAEGAASRREDVGRLFESGARRVGQERHEIENMLGCLNDWWLIALRYARLVHAILFAICIAAAIAIGFEQ